jgi:hypothetical protein
VRSASRAVYVTVESTPGLVFLQLSEMADDQQNGDLVANDAAAADGESTAGSQFAVRFPQVDTPLRLEPPASMNVPLRTDELTQEQRIRATAFSPASFSLRPAATAAESAHQTKHADRTHSENQAPHRTAIADYTMLATSSQRADRPQMEALAYYCMGVVLDNMGQYSKACEAYSKYQAVCQKLNDTEVSSTCKAISATAV